MRIISKFHDYYDTISRYDLEHSDIYLRKSEDVLTPEPLLKYVRWSSVNVVGFCGKLYPFIRVSGSRENGYISTCVFDSNAVMDSVKETRYYVPNSYYDLLQNATTVFDASMFIEFGCPSFVVEGTFTTLNPILRDLNFQKVYSPWEAWHAIDRFRQEHFKIQEPMSMHISDEAMAKKKGFGNKYDFRRLPSKRR